MSVFSWAEQMMRRCRVSRKRRCRERRGIFNDGPEGERSPASFALSAVLLGEDLGIPRAPGEAGLGLVAGVGGGVVRAVVVVMRL